MTDNINNPKHYNSHPSGIECIQVVEHMPYCLGNAIKYIWRAGLKGNPEEDLKKAIWYIQRELERLQDELTKRFPDSDMAGPSSPVQPPTNDPIGFEMRRAVEAKCGDNNRGHGGLLQHQQVQQDKDVPRWYQCGACNGRQIQKGYCHSCGSWLGVGW